MRNTKRSWSENAKKSKVPATTCRRTQSRLKFENTKRNTLGRRLLQTSYNGFLKDARRSWSQKMLNEGSTNDLAVTTGKNLFRAEQKQKMNVNAPSNQQNFFMWIHCSNKKCCNNFIEISF